jgi:hypothetical protein
MWPVCKTFSTALLLFALTSTGCNGNRVSASSIEGQIGHAIQDKCPRTSDCPIRLRDVTSFDWDKMFYFDYTVSPAERGRAVGVQFKTNELRRQLVFLRGGSVVRNDLLPTDIERPVENEIAFDGGKQIDRISCDNEAQFVATRGDGGTGVMFFQLKTVSADHCR